MSCRCILLTVKAKYKRSPPIMSPIDASAEIDKTNAQNRYRKTGKLVAGLVDFSCPV